MKFRPSNGTEGDMFMERNCNSCKKMDWDDGCLILLASWKCEIDDLGYPEEWQCDDRLDPRTWRCMKYELDEGLTI